MNTIWDVLVVGAGVEGSATSYNLVKEGLRTLLLEQFPLPHTRGSSHGGSRIIKRAYETEIYTEMMVEAYRLWENLERESKTTLFTKTGLLLLEGPPFKNLNVGKKCFENFKLAYRWLKNDELQRKYPSLNIPKDYEGFYEIDGGTLAANKVLDVYQGLFRKYGGTIHDCEPVVDITPGEIITVRTPQASYQTKHLIITPGPWSTKLLKPLELDLPLKVIRVDVCFFYERNPSRLPAVVQFVDWPSDMKVTYIYSLPSEFEGYTKVGIHDGYEVDPDKRDVGVKNSDVKKLSELVKKFLPGLDPKPSIIEPCLYTCAPDEHWILDKHPIQDNILIATAFAGRGFKMAPIVGKILTELVKKQPPSYDLDLFKISRFSTKKSHL